MITQQKPRFEVNSANKYGSILETFYYDNYDEAEWMAFKIKKNGYTSSIYVDDSCVLILDPDR
jgi:hypothetical protein